MRREVLPLLYLLGAALLAGAAPGFAATAIISGQVLLGGTPLAGTQIVGAKATCTTADASGNYSCSVTTPWSGTLAAIADGYAFVPAARSFTGLGTSTSAMNFAATPAYGVRAELALYRPSSGQFLLDYDYDSRPDSAVGFGAPGDVPLAGDVNGDGIDDLVVFRNGIWYADTDHNGIADRTFAFGGPGDLPLIGDMDSDGIADLVVFRGGAWYVSTARNGAASAVYFFGAPGDIPLLGDFNGDGITDLAIFRNGIWYIDTNRDGIADMIIAFGGVTGEIPVALDVNGDGRTDIAVYRGGLWYVNTNLDGVLNLLIGYGAASDRPLAGFFNSANTLFVKAGSGCTVGCTQANPYATITGAWQDATEGQIIRIAKGAYPESLRFSYPGNQYAPGKFGKNGVKLLGVSKHAVSISPASGDALELQGATGYFVRGVRLQSLAIGARGLLLSGGPGSYIPSFPGAQVNVALSDITENDGQNVLLTGSANAWLRYTRLNRSRSSNGMSTWSYSYARVTAGEASQNGYTIPPGPPVPGVGRGFETRDDSELDVRRTVMRQNLTFGVIGVDRSKVNLAGNTIESNGYNGTIFCGVPPNDQTQSTLTNNWIAANGTADPASGYNGTEYYATCVGTHQVIANTYIGNTLNGVFVGSGTVTLSGNAFKLNKIGVTLFANDGVSGSAPSSADTVVNLFGNLFQANTVDGLYAERYLTTSGFKIIVTVGGTGAGQPNTFRDHLGGAFHAISCLNVTTQFVCPTGGNAFINNTDNIEKPACPSSCVQ